MYEKFLAFTEALATSLILTDDTSQTSRPLNDRLGSFRMGRQWIRAWQPSIARDRFSMGRDLCADLLLHSYSCLSVSLVPGTQRRNDAQINEEAVLSDVEIDNTTMSTRTIIH